MYKFIYGLFSVVELGISKGNILLQTNHCSWELFCVVHDSPWTNHEPAAEIAEAVVTTKKKQVDSRVVEEMVRQEGKKWHTERHTLYTHVSGPESTRYIYIFIYISLDDFYIFIFFLFRRIFFVKYLWDVWDFKKKKKVAAATEALIQQTQTITDCGAFFLEINR